MSHVFAWMAQPATAPGTDGAGDVYASKSRQQRGACSGEGLGFLQRIQLGGGGDEAKQQQGRRKSADDGKQRAAVVQPIGVAVSALSAFYGVKGILKGYQQLRRRNLRHLICTVAPVLDSLGATYWLDFGSLLGAQREKDVIAHDNDADIVIFNPDWGALLIALRQALPQFRVFFVIPSEDRTVKWLRVVHQLGVMDLYGAFAGPESGAAPGMISIPQGHGDLCDIPTGIVFPLGSIKFRGAVISAPGDIHSTLVFRYGADYMVPKYMCKGRDEIEQGKMYCRLLGFLGKAGLRI